MHLWQYEAQFGFCFRLDLTTLGQANMLRRKPIPGILAGSLALLKLLSSPIRNLLLTSPPWQGFILILTFLRYVLTVTDVYWHLLTWKLKMVLLTWPGGAHFLLRLLLHPVTRASCEKNQYFLRMNDWKGLERIGKDWKGGIQWKYLSRSKSFLVNWCVLGLLKALTQYIPVLLQPSLRKFRTIEWVQRFRFTDCWAPGAFVRSSLEWFGGYFDSVLINTDKLTERR
jgi:hypothetical protein